MKRIMLVDDKEENLYLMKSILESDEYTLITARNGAEALGLLKLEEPDLIITDILMPVMDGFTLCRECRKDKRLKNIPIFFYTATYTSEMDKEYALNCGADRFILKPQEPDVFYGIIKDFLSDINSGKVEKRSSVQTEDSIILKQYNEVLIRKIEDKMIQTEKTEKELRKYAETLEKEIDDRKRKEKALNESEAKYKQLVTHSPDGIFIVDLTGKFISVNKAICETLNYTEEEMMGMSLLQIIPEKFHSLHRTRLQALVTGAVKNLGAEYEVIKRDGSTVYVEIISVPYLSGNEMIGFQGIARDITKRKKMEKLLLEKEEMYRSIYENSSVAIMLTIPDGRILSANDYACKMFGRTEQEILESGRIDLVDISDPRLPVLLEERNRTGRAIGVLTFIRKNGTRFEAEVSSVVFKDSDGNPRTSMVIRDLTEQIKAEKVLRDSEARFRSYFESVVAGVAITSPEKGWIEVNSRLCEMLQYSKDELVHMSWPELTFYDDLDKDLIEFEKVMQGKIDAYSLDKRFIRKDNSIIWTNLSVRCLRRTDGSVDHFVALIYDITSRKLAEEELIRAKLKAEESDRLKTAFLHNISHEIRTPLNGIVGFSSLLMETDMDKDTQESFINTIIENSDHLLVIINDIIEISNIEAGIVKINKSNFRLNQVINNIVTQFTPLASRKKIDFVFSNYLSDQELDIYTDKTKLIQIISNLVSNAFKFTDKGKIEIGYSLDGKIIRFNVSDTGIGIPADELGRIFDRFYQVEHTLERKYEGTGLGLSITKSFIEILGGRIWVESKPGSGSVFYFTIPYNDDHKQSEINKEAISLRLSRPVTLVVAEDNDSNYFLISKYIASPLITLVRAYNGLEAVEYFKAGRKADMVLMDLKMPVMDGYESATEIKKIVPGITIVAQTAFVTDREKIFSSGCDDVLNKPFNKYELIEVVNKYLNA